MCYTIFAGERWQARPPLQYRADLFSLFLCVFKDCQTVDFLQCRNAAAHSNCLINRLFDPLEQGKQIDSEISNFVKSVSDINSKTRSKNLNYSVVYNFVTLIYIYSNIVSSEKAKEHQYKELKDFFNVRVAREPEYFKSNSKLMSIYNFVKKIVDNLNA